MESAASSLTTDNSVSSRLFLKKLAVHAGALLSLAIVCVALWVLNKTLHQIQITDVFENFKALPMSSIFLAFLITAVSYFVITGYDVLALRHIGRPLPYSRSGLAAFLASAFGNNIGFALLTGGSIRYRIYSQAGLSTLEIAGVTTMCSMTSAMGMAFVLAVSMAFGSGETTNAAIHIPPDLRQAVGGFMLVLMAGYLIVAAIRPLSIRTRSWSLQLPSAKTAITQGFLATLEMLLVGSLIYVLLPADTGATFINFIGVFVLALMGGSMSNVPGGIGVFESILLLGLPEVPPAALLGAVLLFRCVYYLAPLSLAAILFASYEALSQRAKIIRVHGVATDILAEVGPQVMAILVIVTGAVLLFSGTIPATPQQHAELRAYLPLWLVEFSHVLASAVGLGLVIVARGISRRLRAAYSLTLMLLMVGIVSSYFKGLDYDEAIALSAIFLMLFPTKREFYREGSLFSQGFTVEWMSVLTALLAFVVWLGLFNYRFTPYDSGFWWTFAYDADVARCLRSTLVIFLITGGVALLNLVRPDPVPVLPQADELKRVRRIIKNEPDTRANLALLGDKRLLFGESGAAFLMYQVQGKSWVALGEPIGPFKEHAQILLTYRELCDRHGGWPVFYLIDAQHLSHYVDLGLSILKLGDEARVSLSDFSVLSVTSAAIRDVHREVRAQDVRLEILNSAQVSLVLPELEAVSQAWLAGHDMREQGFSKGFFDPAYVSQFPCAVVRKENRIVAFAVLWASPNKEELALDLMRFHPDAPKGVIDFLLVELILGGKARGYRWFNLGVSPLPGLQDHPLAPVWQRIGKLIYRQGEHFQNIESLRRYEENFNPVWRTKYLASPGGANLPRVLRDIAKLNARGRIT